MKRILLPGLLLSALAVLSCEREMEMPAGNTVTIKASLDNETKTAYEGEKTFTWLSGDRIAVLADTENASVLIGFQTDTKAPTAEFMGELPAGAQLAGEAYYPETLASLDGDNEVVLTFPAAFTPDPENPLSCVPLIGRVEDSGGYHFKTAGSILKLTVSGIPGDATGIRLSHVNETPILSGTFSVPANGTVTYREVIDSENHVTAYFTPETAGETRSFFFPMAVQTIPGGMVVTLLRSGSGDLPIAVTAHAIELPRNTVVNLSTVASEQAYTSIYAYFPSMEVRSTLDSATGSFAWKAGDEIDVAASLGRDTWQGRRFVTTEEGNEVRFLLANEEETDSLALGNWAFYPSRTSEVAQDGGYNLQWDIRPNYYPEDLERYPGETELITVDIPPVMALPAENPTRVLPLLGRREADLRYCFTPMTALLGVPVTGLPDGADFVTLTSATAALSGSFHLDTVTGAITQESTLSANPEGLTLTYSDLGDGATFWFPIPGGTFEEGFTLRVGCSSDPDEAMVTTVGAGQTLHSGEVISLPAVVFTPVDQQWEVVAENVPFLDDFIWAQHSAYTAGTTVPVTLERSGLHPEKYRINNPYTVANAQFGYTPYTEGIEADPYLIMIVKEDGLVYFYPFRLGIEDKDSGGKAMSIMHATDWSASRKGTYSKVVSTYTDGVPMEIQLAAMYHETGNTGYSYTRDGEGTTHTDRIHIGTTVEQWTDVAEGEFIDDLLWSNHGWGTTRVPVVLQQSDMIPEKLRVANPYLQAADKFGFTPYTAGIESADYLELTLQDNNLIYFKTFLAGIEDKPSGGKPMKIWYPKEWGSSYDVSYNKVLSWRSDELPAEIQLAAMYSDPVTVSYKYTKYTTPTIHLYFPEEEVPAPEEHWSEVGAVRYRDNFTYENCPYVAVRMDHSDLGRYRIENPYPVLAGLQGDEVKYTPDEYLYLTIADNGLIDFDPLVTGIEKYGWDFSISHPSEIGKNVNYNKVLSYDDSGNALILQLAPIYHQTGAISSGNKYSRDTYDDMVRILMPGVPDKSGLAVVEHVQYPLHAGEKKQIMKVSYPSGTVDSWTVTSDHPELVEEYTLDGGKIYVTMKEGPYQQLSAIRFTLTEFTVDGAAVEIDDEDPQPHHLAVRVRKGGYTTTDGVTTITGDDGIASFRIPALVTSNRGTLIAAYDIRRDNSTDLQGDIDVGVSRSTDGGVTWEPMIVAMDMGIWGYEEEVAAGTMTEKDAQKLNGIGDPCLLVDENTGELFCFAVWAHAHANSRCIYWAGTGFEIEDTPQLMMVRSTDDGLTWSEPVNLTRQVKRYDWKMTFQGPGRGITMHDGTLVVPIQHQEGSNSAQALCSGIMYSTDHGRTWHAHNYARATTSESTVAEIEPGVLMLSMRDETNAKTRAVYVTRDLGRTWTPHASDGKVIEPTCEASLLHVDAADNALGRNILLFANPHSASGRNHETIQISFDGGETWPHSILLDTGGWQGYSCLTMIDSETVGIVHESESQTIIFQAVPLTSIVR